jgi:hypothetical protein
MIILGLLVLLVVVVVSVVAIARGGDPVTFKVGSLSFDTDGTGMFLAGAGTLLLLVVGLWLLTKGLARSRRRRQEMRELRDRAARSDGAGRREGEAVEPGGSHDATTADNTRTDTARIDEPGRHADADDHFDSAPRDTR